MGRNTGQGDSADDDVVYVEHDPTGDRQLSSAILAAIETQKGEDLSKSESVLYDDINPDAIDSLFRSGGVGSTRVVFDTSDVTVTLAGNGIIEIRVAPQEM